MNRRATMGDVARLAKVGKITVSRVLNGNPHVAERTKKRVLAAVKKLGYVPDEAARSLRSQKSRCIGLITHSLLNPFFAVIADAIHETAQKNGYMVMTLSSQGNYDVEASQIRTLLCRRVDGLMIVPASSRKCVVCEPGFAQLPVVAFDRPLPGDKHDCVLVENQRGAGLAVQHLVEHGNRRIAFVGPQGSWYTIRERLQGFRDAAAEHGIETKEVSGVDDLPSAITIMEKLIDGPAAPTAVFMPNNVTTMLVLEALHELRVNIPDTLAVIGFDNFELAHMLRPPLTVIAQPINEMARRAAELLFERLEEGAAAGPPRRIDLPVELIIRKSCGCEQQSPACLQTVSARG